MSQLFTTFSETIIKVGKDEVLKDNTEKNIEDDISTEDSAFSSMYQTSSLVILFDRVRQTTIGIWLLIT
jgi:hypothetical protein